MPTTIKFFSLGEEGKPFTRKLVLKAGTGGDLTETSTGTAQEFHAVIPANSILLGPPVLYVPTLPFNSADAAFDDVKVSIGDSAASGNMLPDTQVAKLNGTPITLAIGNRIAALTLGNTDGEIAGLTFSSTPTQAELNSFRTKAEELADDVRAIAGVGQNSKVYGAADYLKIVVTPKTGKALSALDNGEINILVPLLVVPLIP